MELKKFVITGGPCGGKSTAMKSIKEHFTNQGYTTLVISETATEFISGGVAPWTCGTNAEYQKIQMTMQLTKEDLFEKAARGMGKDKILILCDRGALDNRAYMNEQEYKEVLDYVYKTEEALLNRYDGVIHLMTAAKGKPEVYTCANNTARSETAEEAIALDDKVIEAWKKHANYSLIDNSGTFDDKIARVIEAIEGYLHS